MYIGRHFGVEKRKIFILIAEESPSEGVGKRKSLEVSTALFIIVESKLSSA